MPVNPEISATTDYEVMLNTNTAIPQGAYLEITLPAELTLTSNSNFCNEIFTAKAITCVVVGGKIKVEGLFTTEYTASVIGINLTGIRNPSTSGRTDTFKFEIKEADGTPIAEKLTDTYSNIQEPYAGTCSIICKTCVGTEVTCTSCNVPSNQPVLKEYSCSDRCGEGYFMKETSGIPKCY